MLRFKKFYIFFGILTITIGNTSFAGWRDFFGIQSSSEPRRTPASRPHYARRLPLTPAIPLTSRPRYDRAPLDQQPGEPRSLHDHKSAQISAPVQTSSSLADSTPTRESQIRQCQSTIDDLTSQKCDLRRQIGELEATYSDCQRQQEARQCQLEQLKFEAIMDLLPDRLQQEDDYRSSFLDSFYTSLITEKFLLRHSSVEFVFLAIGNAYTLSSNAETQADLTQLVRRLNDEGFYIIYDADSLTLKEYFKQNHFSNVILGISSQEENDKIWKIANPYLRLKAINSIPKIIASLDSIVATSVWLLSQSDTISRDFYTFGNPEMWENSLTIWNGWLSKFHTSSFPTLHESSLMSHLRKVEIEPSSSLAREHASRRSVTTPRSTRVSLDQLSSSQEYSPFSISGFLKRMGLKKASSKPDRSQAMDTATQSPEWHETALSSDATAGPRPATEALFPVEEESTLTASSVQLSPDETVIQNAKNALKKFEDHKQEMPKQLRLGLPSPTQFSRNLKSIATYDPFNYRSYYAKRESADALPMLKMNIQKWSEMTLITRQSTQEKDIVVQALRHADVYTVKSKKLTELSRTFLESLPPSSDLSLSTVYDGIVVFGSSRSQSVDTYGKILNQQLNELFELTQKMPIITGGGGGIMELAQKISEINQCVHIGISMSGAEDSPSSRSSQKGLSASISTSTYEHRIPLLLQNNLIIVAPGGVGTLREIATTFMSVSTPTAHQLPRILFVGDDYYDDLITWLESRILPYALMQSIQVL